MTSVGHIVVYHGSCKDGLAAAWAAKSFFGDDARYLPYYHTNVDDIYAPTGSEVWFLDCCPRAQVLVRLLDSGHQVHVIDHHESNRRTLATIHNPNLEIVMDQHQSGAVLAFRYFFPRRRVPSILLFIQDRDLWTGIYDETEAIAAALDALPMDFDLLDRLVRNQEDVDQLIKSGSLLLSARQQHITRALERVYFDVVGGYEVPVVNADTDISDIGSAVANAHPDRAFAAVWFQLPDGRRKWSLRSVGEFNVSEIAERYGGGGHKNAAGFVDRSDQRSSGS